MPSAPLSRRVRSGNSSLAKSTSTLDVLSGGRLDLGVGVGWQREEYEAAGLDFDRRGALLDHTLAVCQTLWREQRADFDDGTVKFSAIHQMPKPAQPGGVPIWVSGTVNAAVARRVARFGSGWIPWGPAARDLPDAIPRFREAVTAAGRDPDDLQVVGTLPVVKKDGGDIDLERTMDGVAPLAALGVTDFRAQLSIPADRSAARDYLNAVVGAFRPAVGREGG